MSDHKGARLVLEELPSASALIADRGYDSNWLRAALTAKGIAPLHRTTVMRHRFALTRPWASDQVGRLEPGRVSGSRAAR